MANRRVYSFLVALVGITCVYVNKPVTKKEVQLVLGITVDVLLTGQLVGFLSHDGVLVLLKNNGELVSKRADQDDVDH